MTGRPPGWATKATGRPPLRSPGRPPVARREHRQRFWLEIPGGLPSEDAAAAAGVSPAVGARWFREGGGMPTVSPAPLSGRYRSFAEREEIAILRAQGAGGRASARRLGRAPSTISRELRRTQRHVAAGWSIERPRRSGMPAGVRSVPSSPGSPGSPATGSSMVTFRNGCQARSSGPTVWRWLALRCAGPAVDMGAVSTGAGPRRGARSRSRTGCRSTSLLMRR